MIESEVAVAVLVVEIIYGHCPSRKSRFSISCFSTAVDARLVGTICLVSTNDIVSEQIYIPHDQRSGGKIIGYSLFDCALRGGAIIILASHFGSKHRRTFKEFHPRIFAYIKGRIGAKGFSIWQIDLKAGVVGNSGAAASA